MKPQDPPRDTQKSHVAFEAVLTDAIAGHTAYKRTASHALSIGVRPLDLVRYVRGDLECGERDEIQSLVSRSPWAMGRVVALVKARRATASLGSKLLATPVFNPYAWGVRNTGDLDTDGCTLLDSL